MSRIRVHPGPVVGRLTAPSSKSYTHRALVAGFLTAHRYDICRPLDADDTRATREALVALGSTVRQSAGKWTILPPRRPGGRGERTIRCGRSGTTLRFLAALAAVQDEPVTLTGDRELARRPLGELLDALVEMGAKVRRPTKGSSLPVRICGPIRAGRVRVDARKSSQFVSALLLVTPSLRAPSRIALAEGLVSAPYVDATVATLASHGIRIRRSRNEFLVPGSQRYRGQRFLVPGDASSAAYLWSAAAVSGGSVRVDGIPRTWPQADLAVLPVLAALGARVRRDASGATVTAVDRRSFEASLDDAPDLFPLLGTVAAVTPGRSRLSGASHVIYKESDRRVETERIARSLGARTARRGRSLVIEGTARPRAIRALRLSDHRLVMSAAVGALAARGPSLIGDASAVAKSYPGFWEDLASLGVVAEAAS